MPQGDINFSHRWQAIKMAFSKAIPPRENLSESRRTRAERSIWQRRFWGHTIRDDRDYAAHLDYTHFNPVKHGLAPTPAAWPHSSFHRAVASGLYPLTWSDLPANLTPHGERPPLPP